MCFPLPHNSVVMCNMVKQIVCSFLIVSRAPVDRCLVTEYLRPKRLDKKRRQTWHAGTSILVLNAFSPMYLIGCTLVMCVTSILSLFSLTVTPVHKHHSSPSTNVHALIKRTLSANTQTPHKCHPALPANVPTVLKWSNMFCCCFILDKYWPLVQV